MENTTASSYETLIQQFSFASPSQASNALATAKRQFQRTLQAVIEQYVETEEDVEEELRELRNILSRGLIIISQK